jgi:gamma-butyrobetaine dioxygenase
MMLRLISRMRVRNRVLEMEWSGDNASCQVDKTRYHDIWLRHQCRCAECKDSTSNDRLLAPHVLIDDDLSSIDDVKLIESDGDSDSEQSVEIVWKDGHRSRFEASWLDAHAYDEHRRAARNRARRPPLWQASKVQMEHDEKEQSLAKVQARLHVLRNDGDAGDDEALPVVDYAHVMDERNDDGVWQWLGQINRFGISFMRNVPAEECDASSGVPHVQRVAERIGHLRETAYGRTWAVRSVPNADNVAYTSLGLGFHADLEYYETPPGLQLLHCVRFDDSVTGGASTFVDGFRVARDFRRAHPEHYETLCTVPATFQKDDPWRHFYHRRTIIDANEFGDTVKMHFSPQFEGPVDVPHKQCARFYGAYVAFADFLERVEPLRMRLAPGDLITFNNHRVLHGRDSFALGNRGTRHLHGTYVDIEEYACRFRMLRRVRNIKEPLLHGSTSSV